MYTNPYTNFLLGELLVLLTFIELLMNHSSGTRVQGMATAVNITKSEKKAIPNLQTQTSLANN